MEEAFFGPFFSLLWLLSLNTYFRHRLKDTGKVESDSKLALSGCSPSSVAGAEWSWEPSHGGTLLCLSASPLCVWGPHTSQDGVPICLARLLAGFRYAVLPPRLLGPQPNHLPAREQQCSSIGVFSR